MLRYESLPLHLILSARRSPSLSFSRLKVHERVVDIKTADLRFTDSEAFAYLRETVPVPLSAAAIHQLQEKTEGWAVGLTLAAINLRDEVQPEQLITHLDRPDRLVIDYLLDQVFTNQPDEIQEFLLKTATFSQFCAAMLSEVLDSKQSEGEIQVLLEHIEDAQLFLSPLDTQRFYYRYHHLFRQMLLSRQRVYFHPDQIASYHRRAAAWLTRNGQTDEALGHLITVRIGSARRSSWKASSVHCSMLRITRGSSATSGIFRKISSLPVPGLLLMQAWIAHFGLRLAQMHSLTARIQVMLDAALLQSETAESALLCPDLKSSRTGPSRRMSGRWRASFFT